MHYPLEIGYGNFTISAHLLFESLAFFIGFRYFLYLRKRQTDKISEPNRVWILIGAAFGSFFFSRLIGALENPILFLHTQHPFLYFYANKTIIGGLLGGLLAVEIVKKIIHEKSSSGDLFTYPLILAMAIGRFGCLTSGVYEETYGVVTRSFLGMNLGDGLLRHPVALYEIVFLAALALLLQRLESARPLREGYRFQLFMVAYLLFRLMIDFIKPGYKYFYGLGTIQICCIFGLLYYYKIIGKLLFNRTSLYINGNQHAQLYLLRRHDQSLH